MDPSVIGKQIQQSYPQYAKADPVVLGNKYLQKYGGAISSIQGGQLKVEDLPQEQRVGVSIGLQGVGFKPETPESKKQSELEKQSGPVLSLIDSLEQRFQEAEGGESSFGPIARLKGLGKTVSSKLGMNTGATLYKDQKEGFTAALKQLTGDTGVLTDQDYERISKLLPGLGSTGDEAKGKFNDLRKQLSATFGGEQTQTNIKPKNQSLLQEVLAPGKQLAGFAKDVGTGAALKYGEGPALEQSQEGAMDISGKLEMKALTAKDPEEKKRLLKVAQNARRSVSQGTAKKDQFSEDIEKDYLQRGFETGSNIATIAEAPAILKVLKNARTLKPKIPTRFSEKAIGEARDLAVKEYTEKGVKVKGDKIVSAVLKAADESGADITPQMEKYAMNAIKKYEGKELNPSQVLKIFTNSQKAFTSAGKVGKSAPAAYNKAVHDAVAEEIGNLMPNVAKNTALFRQLYGTKKTASNALRTTATVAGGVAGSAYLLNVLRGKGGVQ